MIDTSDPRLLSAVLANLSDQPDPNDIPPPDGPGAPPNIPSDGRGSPLQRWREQGATEQARIAAILAKPASPDIAAQTAAPDPHKESAGRGIARLMRHDRARFLRCVARVGDNDRRAMAGALESYLTAQPHLFTGAPSADRILAFWAHESAV